MNKLAVTLAVFTSLYGAAHVSTADAAPNVYYDNAYDRGGNYYMNKNHADRDYQAHGNMDKAAMIEDTDHCINPGYMDTRAVATWHSKNPGKALCFINDEAEYGANTNYHTNN